MSIIDSFKYEDLLGKEFQYGGRGPDTYDCYGLCIEVLKRAGKKLPEYNSESKPSVIHGMIQEGKQFFEEINQPEPFCLVAFCIIPPFVSHIGVVLNPPYFIHIMEKSRVTVERLDSLVWQKRIRGYYRCKS